jgi:hypothetical protein
MEYPVAHNKEEGSIKENAEKAVQAVKEKN